MSAVKSGIELSRKRIKSKSLARKFRALGEAVFDCGGIRFQAKDLLDKLVEESRDDTLEHLAVLYRAQQKEIQSLKEKAGLHECCICGAPDDAPIRRLAEEDDSLPGFTSLRDLEDPDRTGQHQRCTCTNAYMCPTCFGRQRVSVMVLDGSRTVYDMVRCPSCRTEKFFEIRQVQVADLCACDSRIIPSGPAASKLPITLWTRECQVHRPSCTPQCTCVIDPEDYRVPSSPSYAPSSPPVHSPEY